MANFSGKNLLNLTVSTKDGNMTTPYSTRYVMPVPIIIVMLVIILLVNLVGNSLVALVIMKKQRMRTFTNWLILNLAVADLSVALICIPLEIPLELNNFKWIYGKVFCKLFYPLQSATIFASAFTLVTLSCSRYWAIVHPFKRQPNLRAAKVVISIIWLSSFLLVIPFMLGLDYVPHHEKCEEVWNPAQRHIYTIAVFIIQFCIPLVLITVASTRIIYEMAYKQSFTYKDKKRDEENKKLLKLLVAVSSTFAVCCVPTQVVTIVVEFRNGYGFEYIEEIWIAAYILLYSNSALNPIIYNIFNSSFHSGLANLFRGFLKNSSNENFEESGRPRNQTVISTDSLPLKNRRKDLQCSEDQGKLMIPLQDCVQS